MEQRIWGWAADAPGDFWWHLVTFGVTWWVAEKLFLRAGCQNQCCDSDSSGCQTVLTPSPAPEPAQNLPCAVWALQKLD